MTKFCSKCNRIKGIHLFHTNKNKKDGFQTWCKFCTNSRSRLKQFYGITYENYKELLLKQNKQCKICNSLKPSVSARFKYFTIDHDHKTGKIRGLLCSRCNRGLGYFKDNITNLKQAVKYLENS